MEKKNLKIKGLKGTWYILDEQVIKDKNNIEKKVYMIESELYGESAITYIDENKNFLKELDDFEDFEEVQKNMKNLAWDEIKEIERILF